MLSSQKPTAEKAKAMADAAIEGLKRKPHLVRQPGIFDIWRCYRFRGAMEYPTGTTPKYAYQNLRIELAKVGWW